MNNKSLAIIGMAGAPFLCLGMITEMLIPSLSNTRFSGAWSIIYISAWTCTMAAVYRMNLLRHYRLPQALLYLLFVTLTIANVSNILLLITGDANTPFYFYLDLCWPLSNIIMLMLGLSLIGKQIVSLKLRYAILITGTWLPFCVIPVIIFGKTTPLFVAGGVYSLINWTVLAYAVWQLAKEREVYAITAGTEQL